MTTDHICVEVKENKQNSYLLLINFCKIDDLVLELGLQKVEKRTGCSSKQCNNNWHIVKIISNQRALLII